MSLCFDLDGTLGSFGGGYVLLREALGELWGETPSTEDLRACRGSTDWEIVDELHRGRFQTPLQEDTYAAYDRLCLARFQATFQVGQRDPVIHIGLVQGMTRLIDQAHETWIVSGNAPQVLAFKAQALGVDSRVKLLGSLPHCDRATLLAQALRGSASPHLYVGDRPHDRDAALRIGIPFLGVGSEVPGAHPCLAPTAEADHLVDAVMTLIR